MIRRLESMKGMIGRLRQISWAPYYLYELEADFLALYRIEDPWSMSAPRFFRLALRTPYYQGAMQAKVMAEQERQEKEQPQRGARYSSSPEISSSGVDMRHNMAAAKAAAKGLKGANAEEVRVVPTTTWMSMAPPGTVEHVVATA